MINSTMDNAERQLRKEQRRVRREKGPSAFTNLTSNLGQGLGVGLRLGLTITATTLGAAHLSTLIGSS